MNVNQLSESLNIPYKKIVRYLSQVEPATNWELDTEVPEIYQLELQNNENPVPALLPTPELTFSTANTVPPVELNINPVASAAAAAYITAYLHQYDQSLRHGINKVHGLVHEQLLHEAQSLEQQPMQKLSLIYEAQLERQLKELYRPGKSMSLIPDSSAQ